ncbi:MAG TPA: DUF2339 domain-containing protein [Bryobacteraceae bacterium]|nr:DUF2339 domain-containing protein [Bryobacteraceae bacterium]
MSELLLWIAVIGLIFKLRSLSNRLSELEGLRFATPDVALPPMAMPPPLPYSPEPQAPEPEPVVAFEPPPIPQVEVEAAEVDQEAPRPAVDWEAVLGGNLLNKLGVLLLIVGIALFLGYSLRELGPGGRIAVGVLASLTLLGGGLFAERREDYQLFGRGLIGGGWAGLYFTAFAAYAVPAAQIITDPIIGTLLLASVSAAMIGFSLRYRSETVTGMAYLLSFLALAISGIATLAIAATIPLAASLIYVAYRFGWMRLIMAGLPIAYAVFFLHSQAMTAAQPHLTKVLLLTYWIVFEAADVLRPSGSRLPFFLNAICFSFLAWGSPAIAASAYAASTAMRIAYKREYRGAVTAFAVLCGSAVYEHTSGLTTVACLLLEAQLVFLAGVRFQERFVRWLGAGAFIVAIGQLLTEGAMSHTREWAILTAIAALAMYVNRWLHRESFGYSFAGTALTALVLATETPLEWLGVCWLALTGVLSVVHSRTEARDFFWQTLAMASLAVSVLGAVNVIGIDQPSPLPWGPQLVAALMLFAGAMRSRFAAAAATCGTVMAAVLAWNILPASLVALGWAAIALMLFETRWKLQGEAMALAAFGRLFFANFDTAERLLTSTPVVALQYYFYVRGRRLFVYTGAIAAAALMRFELGRLHAVVGWSLMFVICQFFGARRDNRDLRYQAYLLAAVTFVHCWVTNFYEPAVFARVWIGAAVIASLFVAHLVSRRDQETFARPLFSTLGSALLSVLLYYEVSGKVLTMTWAVQGAVLLGCGFGLRERHVRLTGLALLAACIAKLFFYDFATLDTPYRIASFLVLGALLIGGSWVYTRFRKQLEGML